MSFKTKAKKRNLMRFIRLKKNRSIGSKCTNIGFDDIASDTSTSTSSSSPCSSYNEDSDISYVEDMKPQEDYESPVLNQETQLCDVDVGQLDSVTSPSAKHCASPSTQTSNFEGADKTLYQRDTILKSRLEALRMQQQIYGTNHPDVLFAMQSLGLAHCQRGEFGHARRVFQAKERLAYSPPAVPSEIYVSPV